MITYIYGDISKNKCIKCMILMHEIACYQITIEIIQLIAGFKAFYSAISKISSVFKRRILPNQSTKSHFQPLRGCRNESRSDWKQEIKDGGI